MELESADGHWLLNPYRHLPALRWQEPAFAADDFVVTDVDDELLINRRTCEKLRVLVALNFGNPPRALQLDRHARGKIFLSTYLDQSGSTVEGNVTPGLVGLENS